MLTYLNCSGLVVEIHAPMCGCWRAYGEGDGFKETEGMKGFSFNNNLFHYPCRHVFISHAASRGGGGGGEIGQLKYVCAYEHTYRQKQDVVFVHRLIFRCTSKSHVYSSITSPIIWLVWLWINKKFYFLYIF